jgi:hypothetical protein
MFGPGGLSTELRAKVCGPRFLAYGRPSGDADLTRREVGVIHFGDFPVTD